jgi:CubicO group peptidase (beta-lactamase class C family)
MKKSNGLICRGAIHRVLLDHPPGMQGAMNRAPTGWGGRPARRVPLAGCLRHFVAAFFIIGFFMQAAFADTPKEKIDRYLTKAAANHYSGSVLVASGGTIILQKGYGFADDENKIPFTIDTIFDIGSITKQFTAACILKLESQGKLNVQDSITKYFDHVPADKKGITLHQLLTHTAGLVDSLGADEEMIGRDDFVAKALSSPLIHSPGSYDYSNVGFSLLAAVVEKVSGKDYEQYLQQNLLAPAGMKTTGYVLPSWDKKKMAIGYQNGHRWGTTYDQSHYEKGVTWHLKGNGGIHSTVGDMYLWYRALKNNTVLPEKEKEKLFTGYTDEGNGESYYGYGWSIRKRDDGEKVIAHNGGNGFFMATIEMIPARDFVVIVSGNHTPKNTDIIAHHIEQILFDNVQELDAAFISQYSGSYALPSGKTFSVSFDENDQAILQLKEKQPWLLFGGGEKNDADDRFDQKTLALIQAMFDSNVEQSASLAGVGVDEARDFTLGFRKRIEDENGGWTGFESLGTVSRRSGKFHLTPVVFHCEKGDTYRLIIWEGDKILDFRPLPQGNIKEFEHKAGNVFYSASNDRTISFGMDKEKPTLQIGNTIAKKTN